jgi:hypothetical protein
VEVEVAGGALDVDVVAAVWGGGRRVRGGGGRRVHGGRRLARALWWRRPAHVRGGGGDAGGRAPASASSLPTSGLRRSSSPVCSMMRPYGAPFRGGRLGIIPPPPPHPPPSPHTGKNSLRRTRRGMGRLEMF